MSEPRPASAGADPRPQSLMTDPSDTGQLAVRFRWQDDRFVHRIEVAPSASASRAMKDLAKTDLAASPSALSVAEQLDESCRATAWPLSPPLQQLDQCTLSGGGRGLVGVGMAGTSHWSLAVEVRDQQLWFDVACRIQQAPELLQSGYWLAQPASPQAADEAAAGRSLVLNGGAVELRLDPQWTDWDFDEDRRWLHLRPRQIPDRRPATVRWRYAFVATA